MENLNYSDLITENEHIFWEIYESCGKTFDIGCGSYLFNGFDYRYDNRMYEKQLLLFNQTKNLNKVLEIGTYMGHSLFIMLLSNPKLDITCIDISDKFTKPSVEVLRKYFPESKINFIFGNSADVLPNIKESFDLFHIDGTHTFQYSILEFNNCLRMSNTSTVKFFLDDIDECGELIDYVTTNYNVVTKIIPECIHRNAYIEINL
jgi:predicted O-methyltransferase YrrM